ncbi:hypothetical protein A2336_01775, partial [Candidatus Peregrinibacteria bacterium RIFOXYB2_FULL_41_88]
DLFFPRKCVACNTFGESICKNCFARIKKIHEPLTIPNLDCVYAIYRYEKHGVLQMAIKALKYRFIRDIAIYFRQDLGDFLIENFSKKDCVLVPIPLHPKREKWRGFNQSEELIRGLAWPIIKPLKRTRNTIPQAELDRTKRLVNLNGAFAIREKIQTRFLNKKIVLIDDISTTGATLCECAKVLKQAGAKEIYGVILAHGS